MSEYWKSTPKYWCKFCAAYVRDTKLSKQEHEATPRHKGQVQRALRGIHRDAAREEREKQRAKSEVARLNGLVGGAAAPAPASEVKKVEAKKVAAPRVKEREADPLERRRQMAQLAEMGVVVPKEFRGEMAMVGDWETVKRGEKEEGKGEAVSFGVRKRKFEGQEEEEAAGPVVAKKGWGATFKEYPAGGESADLDALLAAPRVKKEEDGEAVPHDGDAIKDESTVKDEDGAVPAAPVFKKRKPKVAKT